MDAADLDATVRTHLANERTFLAWLRTGITFVAPSESQIPVEARFTFITWRAMEVAPVKIRWSKARSEKA